MSQANFDNFDRRMARIARTNQRLARGSRTVVTRDGLIVVKPRRSLFGFLPMRAILFVLIAGYALKVAFFTQMGAEAYSAAVANLTSGSAGYEPYLAYVLYADGLTVWLADLIRTAIA